MSVKANDKMKYWRVWWTAEIWNCIDDFLIRTAIKLCKHNIEEVHLGSKNNFTLQLVDLVKRLFILLDKLGLMRSDI